MLDGASNEIEFKLLEIRKKYNINATQGKIDFLNDAIKILADVSPIEQDLYLTRLADELGVEKNSIKIQLDSYTKKQKQIRKKKEYQGIINDSIRDIQRQSFDENEPIRLIKAEERIIGLLIKYPECINYCKDFDEHKIASPFIKKMFVEIKNRLNNNLGVELINFGEMLTNDELGRLSGIIARTQYGDMNNEKEIKDCIAIICEEYDKRNSSSASNMTDDEFRNMFKKNT